MAQATAVNNQVTDSVTQLHNSLSAMQQPFAQAAAFQAVSHALALALHNAVARQQQSHMLRQAMATAAAKALLEGRSEQAEAVLKLAESPLVNPTLESEVGQLQAALASLRGEIEKTLAVAPPGPAGR